MALLAFATYSVYIVYGMGEFPVYYLQHPFFEQYKTTIFKTFLRDSGMDSLDDGVTYNQLLVKVSIFILVVVILRKQDDPVAHEVSNRRVGDSAVHILRVVMKVLSEDLPTLFQVIF